MRLLHLRTVLQFYVAVTLAIAYSLAQAQQTPARICGAADSVPNWRGIGPEVWRSVYLIDALNVAMVEQAKALRRSIFRAQNHSATS